MSVLLVQDRIVGSFLIAIALLLSVAVLVAVSFQQMNRQKDWVAHTYEVINLLQGVLSGMKDIQSAQRGYLITGVESYLDPYKEALPQVSRDMGTLRELIGDSRQQSDRLTELGDHVRQRMEIARQLITTYQAHGQAAAFSAVAGGKGKRQMDYIRDISAAMIAEEQRLLAERRNAMDGYTRGTITAGVTGLAICFAVLVSAFYQINREALRNKELQQALREQSIRDPLTNLFNRRYMEETIAREIARAKRMQTSLVVMVADIDHFKKVNDTYGHEGGDAVLTAFADLVHTKVRQEDIACRMGGEEFVIILPGITQAQAEERANDICRSLRALPVDFDGKTIMVTTSVGVSFYPDHATEGQKLVALADAALYQAKHGGRDRVKVYIPSKQEDAA